VTRCRWRRRAAIVEEIEKQCSIAENGPYFRCLQTNALNFTGRVQRPRVLYTERSLAKAGQRVRYIFIYNIIYIIRVLL